MGVVHLKEPSELARKTFSGLVVMNYYPTVSRETGERIMAQQKKRQAEEAESQGKLGAEEAADRRKLEV